MKFSDLIYGAEVLAASGDAEVSGLQYDSRKVQRGDCFVAMRGKTTDGNNFIDAAIKAGATAVVSDSHDASSEPRIAWARVQHGRKALGILSANFYGRPAEKLNIVGITGTNGKTTTSFLVEAMLRQAGRTSALVGTIEYRIGSEIVTAPHTTPESLELNKFFAQAVNKGARDAVMEVSSHALAQERVFGVPFDVAVFTNLTRDHLDYHHGMGEYFAAKRKLFEGCGTQPPRIAVSNIDDEYGRKLGDYAHTRSTEVYTYGLKCGDFHSEDLQIESSHTRFRMVTPDGAVDIVTRLLGTVNVYNVLAASAAARARGVPLEQIAAAVRNIESVPGRFQRVDAGQPFTVIVDYAHTDDALRNLTSLARSFVLTGGKKGRVITLFGCGGDRDRAKRPLMAKAAGEGSDLAIVTSDNPRSEAPLAIIHDALPGLENTRCDYTVEPDRRKAIRLAVELAAPGDIVLLAGKGHEKTQTIGRQVLPFDDVQVALAELHRAGFGDDTSRQKVAV